MPETTKRLLAELLGTFVLVTFGSFAIFSANFGNSSDGAVALPQGTPVLIIALGFGFGLLVALYMFGEVSGGHFNPAVSLSMWLDGRLEAGDFLLYTIAQIAGAILASLAVMAAFTKEFVASTATVPNVGLGVSDLDALLLEVLFTAFFIGVILKVTSSAQGAVTAFLAIAFTLLIVHVVLVPLTGTSVNPARTLGPAIVGGEFTSIWVYMVGPMVGALIGWGVYKLVASDNTAEAS